MTTIIHYTGRKSSTISLRKIEPFISRRECRWCEVIATVNKQIDKNQKSLERLTAETK